MQADLVIQLFVRGLITGSVYALLGVSWGIIYNTTRTFHFAHGFIYTLCAYITLTCYSAGFTLLPALLAGLASAMLMGCAIERWVYQPMRANNASQLTVFLSAMGIMIAGQSLIHLIFGPDSWPLGAVKEVTLTLGPITVTNLDIIAVGGSWLALALLWRFLARSRAGVMIRAVASNPEKALFIGIDAKKIFVLVFAIGSLLMGLAAILSTLEKPATPHIGLSAILFAFICVFLGGVGSLLGAAIGGVVLGVVESMVLIFIPTEYKMVVTFSILFLVIIITPEGLLGEKGA